jgi:rhamnosyltransferase
MDTCALIVSYNPQAALLCQQIEALRPQCDILVVDNGSTADIGALLATLEAGVHLLCLGTNRGIAAAQNAGLDYIRTQLTSCHYVLLLDHDSVPGPDFVATLKQDYSALASRHRIAVVGPVLHDPRSGADHPFHTLSGFRYGHVFPSEMTTDYIRCTSINSSGSFGELSRFAEIGPFCEGLFIDHVETEWCARAQHLGYGVFGTRRTRLLHTMGDDVLTVSILGRARHYPYRSPARHRYLYRNSVLLMRQAHVPFAWKINCLAKLTFTLLLFSLRSAQPRQQLAAMLRGLADGLAGRQGRIEARPKTF